MKVLFIGYDFLLENNREILDKLVSNYKLQITILVPRTWRERWRKTAVNYEGNPPTKYRKIAGRIIFPGYNSIHFYYTGILKAICVRPDIIYAWQEPWSLVFFQTSLLKLLFSPESKLIFRTSQTVEKKMMILFRLIEKVNFLLSDAAVTITKEAARVLLKKGFTKKIHTIPHAVDTSVFRPMKKNYKSKRFAIGYIGSFTKQKGLETLLEAVSGLKDTELLMIGSGPHWSTIINKIQKLKLTNVTIFPNVRHSEIPRYLNRMDAFVLPSITLPHDKERFGRVLIEAMACGVPVIGSSSGEIPNVIADAGLIFSEGNSHELRRKILNLMNDGELYQRLTVKGRERVLKNFSWEVVTEMTYRMFKELLWKKGIVYIGGTDWDYLWQRYQQIASRLSGVFPVIYIESPGIRTPSPNIRDILKIFKRLWKILKGHRRIHENLLICSPIVFPFRKFLRLNKWLLSSQIKKLTKNFSETIYWTSIPTKLTLELKEIIKPEIMIYDCPDDYTTFPKVPKNIKEIEQEIIKNSDIILTTSEKLYQQKKQINPKTYLLPNASDYKLFEKTTDVPQSVKNIPPPRIGFIGAIREWVDIELLDYAISALQHYSWIFIGPILNVRVPFSHKKNVYFLGRKNYHELPKYINSFDLCILPFKPSEHMESADPVITYDYLASGKPIVSTKFPQVMKFKEVIRIASDKQEFVKFIKIGLNETEEKIIQTRKEIAKEHSWDRRVGEIVKIICNTVPKTTSF